MTINPACDQSITELVAATNHHVGHPCKDILTLQVQPHWSSMVGTNRLIVCRTIVTTGLGPFRTGNCHNTAILDIEHHVTPRNRLSWYSFICTSRARGSCGRRRGKPGISLGDGRHNRQSPTVIPSLLLMRYGNAKERTRATTMIVARVGYDGLARQNLSMIEA